MSEPTVAQLIVRIVSRYVGMILSSSDYHSAMKVSMELENAIDILNKAL